MIEAIDFSTRLRAIAAAQGKEPFDLLLTGGRVVDVATLELREADVGIVGAMIASVHPRGRFTAARDTDELGGRTVAPGFIDGHVHFESSHMVPHHYASVVVPQGTTTIFCDPHELANVLGTAGARYAVEASRGLPLRFIVQASSCVPAAPGLEISGANFEAPEIAELLSWPEIAGLAEVMDMRAVLDAHPRMVGILREALASGKIIEGHARGLAGPALQAYAAAGISADHEIVSGKDALEKLRAGLTVEIRGSHDYLLPDVVKAINSLPVVPTSLTVCTDDVFPDYLVDKGGISDVLRRLIRNGLDPLQAIRCATINNSIRLRREDLGMVAAGRRADLAVLVDLSEIAVEAVYVGGRRVAANGRMLEALAEKVAPPPATTMKLDPLSAEDFRVRVPGITAGRAVVRTIKGARFNSWSEIEVEVRDGFAVVPEDVSVMTVAHRHGRSNLQPQTTIIEGWDRWRGAYASSYSHDSHNLVVYGYDASEMALAANTVIEMGGGIAVVKGGRVIARIAYPIAGLLSDESPAEVARQHKRIVEAAGEICTWQPPYRTFKALEGQSLACNPGPHLTDQGLTDGETKDIRKIVVRAA
ncbi:MAG TPA: adenine deaminase C-terminal domain-containing protein [Xanthobacteraceae bacterium]|nr:adenine deaminase C-terminal domain-containing protein [Xanthobacteraceae bacterium]